MHDLFIDTYFENASPLRWEQAADGLVHLEMLHDHERFSANQQHTHWSFRVHADAGAVGRRVRFLVGRLDNCWNGRRQPALGREPRAVSISTDGRAWETIAVEAVEDDERFAVGFELTIEAACTHVARIVPYTDSDLQAALADVRASPAVRVFPIGATVEGRPLEMVEIGRRDADHRVLLRARAHPWESGGSWLLDGLMRHLASGEPPAEAVLARTAFCLMPMANKDGVCRGMTRYNVRGADLNRNWYGDVPADPVLAPENACLQSWLSERQRQGRLPGLAICLHNDCNGKLHPGRPAGDEAAYRQRMERFESILTAETWFREGMTTGAVIGGGFASGVMEGWGVDGLIYELNADWAEGLSRPPLAGDWQDLGRDFARVVERYFAEG